MKTSAIVSSLRKASLAAALVIATAIPAWAGKYASIVIDMDSAKVLHARSADETRYPASLTKVMTLYLVFDALDAGTLKLSDRLPVSKFASRQQPSKLGLKAGTTIKVEDAIRALVTKSANDVAVVLAEKLGGSESKFAVKMNAKARELGLEHTTFKNASGLPNSQQVTTARDMAKLAEAIYFDHKDRYKYFSTPQFVWNKRKYMNHNELLKQVAGVDGIKTGYTNASGYNLIASAERDGHRVIAVMMGGTTGRSRDQHVADLLEAAFLEVNGIATDGLADLRERIAFGEHENSTADDLALAQLRKFSEAGVNLASAATGELLDAVNPSTEEDASSTEEADDGDEVAQGDEDSAEDSAADDVASDAAAATPAL
jgi:D-alanyl-D-alanine carboxypeptidase